MNNKQSSDFPSTENGNCKRRFYPNEQLNSTVSCRLQYSWTQIKTNIDCVKIFVEIQCVLQSSQDCQKEAITISRSCQLVHYCAFITPGTIPELRRQFSTESIYSLAPSSSQWLFYIRHHQVLISWEMQIDSPPVKFRAQMSMSMTFS